MAALVPGERRLGELGHHLAFGEVAEIAALRAEGPVERSLASSAKSAPPSSSSITSRASSSVLDQDVAGADLFLGRVLADLKGVVARLQRGVVDHRASTFRSM